MASLIEELIINLEEQNKTYENLLQIATKKKVAIIENNIDDLQNIVGKENEVVGKSLRLDKARTELLNDIKMVLNKKEDITITNLIEAIKGQEHEKKLTELKESIQENLAKLKNLNNQNQELIQISMDYIDYSVNLIRGINSPTYYDSTGNEIDISGKKMFDAKQ